MALPSEQSSVSYVGNNSTVTPYQIPFKFYTGEDISVVVTDDEGTKTTLTPITDYTVTGGDAEAGATGSLTSTVAIPATSTVLILRTVEIVQDTTFSDIGKFPSSAIDRALDYLTMVGQQLSRRLSTIFATPAETVAGTASDLAATPEGVRAAIESLSLEPYPIPLSVANGGTGGTSKAGARTSLEVPSNSQQSAAILVETNRAIAAEATKANTSDVTALLADKADKDGSNLEAASVGLVTLKPDVIAVLNGPIDPTKYLGQITALNQGITAAATAGAGANYSIAIAGTLSGTNAPAIAVEIGDSIIVNAGATAYVLRALPPTNLPDGSVTEPKLADESVSQRTVASAAIAPQAIDTLKHLTAVIVRGDSEEDGDVVPLVSINARRWLGVRSTDGTIVNEEFEAVKETAEAVEGISLAQVTGSDTPDGGVYITVNGVPIIGKDELGNTVLPDITDRILALEEGSGGASTVNILPFYGQSNGMFDISFSQLWRTPAGWDIPTDGPVIISDVPAPGNSRTLADDTLSLRALGNYAFGAYAAVEGPVRGLMDSIVAAYPDYSGVVFTRAEGGKTIEYLSKPTSAEITAGSMAGVTIGGSSAEALMQLAGQDMSHILDYTLASCATRYYQCLWLTAQSAALIRTESKSPRVPAMFWIQGEANGSTADYAALQILLHQNFILDVQAITGQSEKPVMIFEAPQFSTDTISNDFPDLNARQLAASVEGPYSSPSAPMVFAEPMYYLTDRVHRHPYAYRNEGEQLSKVFRKVCIESQQWAPLKPVSWWIDGVYIFVRFAVPFAPIQFALTSQITTHTLVAGMAYGFEHSAGNLQTSKIKIVAPDLIRLEPDTAPATGQTLKYVSGAKYGSLCDSDPTAPIFTDRDSNPNVIRNYCAPFSITL